MEISSLLALLPTFYNPASRERNYAAISYRILGKYLTSSPTVYERRRKQWQKNKNKQTNFLNLHYATARLVACSSAHSVTLFKVPSPRIVSLHSSLNYIKEALTRLCLLLQAFLACFVCQLRTESCNAIGKWTK